MSMSPCFGGSWSYTKRPNKTKTTRTFKFTAFKKCSPRLGTRRRQQSGDRKLYDTAAQLQRFHNTVRAGKTTPLRKTFDLQCSEGVGKWVGGWGEDVTTSTHTHTHTVTTTTCFASFYSHQMSSRSKGNIQSVRGGMVEVRGFYSHVPQKDARPTAF